MFKSPIILSYEYDQTRLYHHGKLLFGNVGFLYDIIYQNHLSYDVYYKRYLRYCKETRDDYADFKFIWNHRSGFILEDSSILDKIPIDINLYFPDLSLLDTIDYRGLTRESLKRQSFLDFLESNNFSESDAYYYGIFSNLVIDDINTLYLTGGYPHPDLLEVVDPISIKDSIVFPIFNWNKDSTTYNEVIGFHSRMLNPESLKFISTYVDMYINVINLNETHRRLVITSGNIDAVQMHKYSNLDAYYLALASGSPDHIHLFQIKEFIIQNSITELIICLDNSEIDIVNAYYITLVMSHTYQVKITHIMLPEGIKDFDKLIKTGDNSFDIISQEDFMRYAEDIFLKIDDPNNPEYKLEFIHHHRIVRY